MHTEPEVAPGPMAPRLGSQHEAAESTRPAGAGVVENYSHASFLRRRDLEWSGAKAPEKRFWKRGFLGNSCRLACFDLSFKKKPVTSGTSSSSKTQLLSAKKTSFSVF